MSAYALLGATGQVGNCILQVLAEDPSRKIHAFVRSKSKLQKMSPEICSSPNLTIFEGDISNLAVLQDCITGTRAVFLAVAASVTVPGIRTAQDQAESVVTALGAIQKQLPKAMLPRLILLSSSETDEKLSESTPWLIRKMLFAASYYIYIDLIEAEKYLRARDDWITCVFMKPGGLSNDIRRGHILSTETQQTFVSCLDLAAGMVELAEEGEGRWDGKNVSVLSHGKAKFEGAALMVLGRGLFVYFFPWLYR